MHCSTHSRLSCAAVGPAKGQSRSLGLPRAASSPLRGDVLREPVLTVLWMDRVHKLS